MLRCSGRLEVGERTVSVHELDDTMHNDFVRAVIAENRQVTVVRIYANRVQLVIAITSE